MRSTLRLLCIVLLALACLGLARPPPPAAVTVKPHRAEPRANHEAGAKQRWDSPGKAFMLPLEILLSGLK